MADRRKKPSRDKGKPYKDGKGKPKDVKVKPSKESKPVEKRFDEPFRPLRNAIVDINPGFWADHCQRELNIARRWREEYGSLAERGLSRRKSLENIFIPSENDPELEGTLQRRRNGYFARPGRCNHCYVEPCICFCFTYSGSLSDLRVSDQNWERLPLGCLHVQQANGFGSSPDFRMINYYQNPRYLSRDQRRYWEQQQNEGMYQQQQQQRLHQLWHEQRHEWLQQQRQQQQYQWEQQQLWRQQQVQQYQQLQWRQQQRQQRQLDEPGTSYDPDERPDLQYWTNPDDSSSN